MITLRRFYVTLYVQCVCCLIFGSNTEFEMNNHFDIVIYVFKFILITMIYYMAYIK